MYKKHLTYTPTLKLTKNEWLANRLLGIGGSEIGTILGKNPYFSSLELFYQKLGLQPMGIEDNEAMFWGRHLESQVADKWQYWDGSVESYLKNYNFKERKRRCWKINAIVRNPKYPQLSANIDRMFKGGILECKTISGWAVKQWATGIPPMYVYQVQQYMLILEEDRAEIAILQDGRNFAVHEFVADKPTQEEIIGESNKFWNKVVYARKKMGELTDANEIMTVVHELEPEPDGTAAYEAFLNEQFKTSDLDDTIKATEKDIELARKYKWYGGAEKKANSLKTEYSSRLKKRLLENNATRMDCGQFGKISWGKSGLRVNLNFDD
jgi:putative phage-type endonuclease